MITIKPFKGWRPRPESVEEVASPPYDVLSSAEARIMADGNPNTFLHVIKPEIDLPLDIDLYSETVYQKAKSNWEDFKERNLFVQDDSACLYFYRQTINGHSQTGIVAASAIDDYFEGRIKKHEFTRPKKENDRIAHMYNLGIHPGPVFLTYKNNKELQILVETYTTRQAADYDFEAADGVRHTLWVLKDEALIDQVTSIFHDSVEASYIADGHHRAAASSKVGLRMREEGGDSSDGRHNYFLSVLFPDNELKIIDYNRLVKDLNGLSKGEFLDRLNTNFEVTGPFAETFKPASLHEFGMYLDGQWYRLAAKPNTFDDSDPIKCLDITVLSDHVIDPILGIVDQRTDDRIDFVGGIRGLKALEERVDSGEMAVAFAIYAVTIRQLIDIADAGMVMPPKSTWFEPKLRSGIVVHEFKD